jgi:hypothetical protein
MLDDCQKERADIERVEERYMPTIEPYLTEWCKLHTWHLVAIDQMEHEPEGDRIALQMAFRLAMQKLELYRACQLSLMDEPA